MVADLSFSSKNNNLFCIFKKMFKILRKGRGRGSEDSLFRQAKIPAFFQEEDKCIR